MHLVGSRGQIVKDFSYDASGTITTGGVAQLILPEHFFRTSIFIQNISSGNLFVEFGGARATATLTNGVVTGVAIANGGFNYTIAPGVKFFGGGDSTKNPNYLCPGLPGNMSPGNSASGVAVLGASTIAGSMVASITINNGGTRYVKPPYVFLHNSEQDPNGVAIPSATNGVLLTPTGGAIFYNGTAMTTDAISIFGATTGQAYTCKYTIGG